MLMLLKKVNATWGHREAWHEGSWWKVGEVSEH